jgi:hypothetical protein
MINYDEEAIPVTISKGRGGMEVNRYPDGYLE